MSMEKHNRAEKFLKDLGVYAIGNLGSKLITFLMVPLYTYYINPSDYGFYDICLVLVFAAVPLMTLQLRDGTFRFLIEDNSERNRQAVATFAYKVMATTTVIALLVGVVLALFHPIRYMWHVVALLVVMSFYEVVTQMTRGLGNTVSFVMSGIISSFGIGVFSLVFVVWLDWGISGIFIANILARFVSLVYIELKDAIIRKYMVAKPEYGTLRSEILKYSLPLLPGVFCWWIIGSSDRFFIERFLGLSINGIYAVAFKFTSILQILATIFYQAWQETALKQYNSADRDKFFSDMFNGYIYIMSFLMVIYTFVLKVNYGWLVSDEFAESKLCIYPMAIAAVLYALSAFMDMGYQCAKDTKRTLPAVVLAAIVNLVLNFVLIRHFGLWGVVLTGILTYAVLLSYRLHDMKRYFKLSCYRGSILPILVVMISVIPYYWADELWINMLYLIFVIAIFVKYMPEKLKMMAREKMKLQRMK